MIEVLLFLGFSALLGGGVVAIVRKGLTSPRFNINPELPAPAPSKMIAGPVVPRAIEASVRAELDTSPGWWDKQFHKALSTSGARVLAEIEGDIIDQRSFDGTCIQYKMDSRIVLEGCTCYDCRVDKF